MSACNATWTDVFTLTATGTCACPAPSRRDDMEHDTPMNAAGKSILAGLQDALAYAQGETAHGHTHTVQVPAVVDVKAIRTRLGLTSRPLPALWLSARFHPELGAGQAPARRASAPLACGDR